jgi:FG-GAP-like repeat
MNSAPLTALLLTALSATAALPFEPQVIDSKITIGYGLATGDVDGDGKTDILLADAKEIVWYRNPAWEKTVIAKNLTLRDNVCLAARDLDGDGRVEIAVGAQWNPGETTHEAESGAIFYLQRPEKDGSPWQPVRLPHEPTTHRMAWVRTGENKHALVVLPLHGRGNVNGDGANGVHIFAYEFPATPADPAAWSRTLIDDSLHVTHNMDVRPSGPADELLIGGREALLIARPGSSGWSAFRLEQTAAASGPPWSGAGEIRFFPRSGEAPDTAVCIEPFHGPNLTLHRYRNTTRTWQRQVLDTTFNQGHALAAADVLAAPGIEIIAGWREPNAGKQFGIKIYHEAAGTWTGEWLGEPNTIACEDLKIADLNADGKPDIIAAGRSTKNVVIYWNRRP